MLDDVVQLTGWDGTVLEDPESGRSTPDVLVVADSENLRQHLSDELVALGFRAVGPLSLGAVLVAPREVEAHVALVDLSGLDASRTVALVRSHLAVPVVTVARRDDRVAAESLDAGATDHLELPFRARVVAARLRAACRDRSWPRPSSSVTTADFRLDFETRRAVTGVGEVNLTPREWALVELLARQEGRLVRHDHLLSVLWGPDKSEHAEYVRVCLHTLRRKLEPEPSSPRYFITVPRVGVRFDPGGSASPAAVPAAPAVATLPGAG